MAERLNGQIAFEVRDSAPGRWPFPPAAPDELACDQAIGVEVGVGSDQHLDREREAPAAQAHE